MKKATTTKRNNTAAKKSATPKRRTIEINSERYNYEIGRKVERIIKRCHSLGLKVKDETSLAMDLTFARDENARASYPNAGNLDLDRLLKSDDFSFIHDVSGIMGHIRRANGVRVPYSEVGKMSRCFDPRCGFIDQRTTKEGK